MAGIDRPGSKVGDRDKALETALAQIERQFGRGSVMRLGDEGRVPIEVIPTGAISLDVALGIGGLPRGRVVEIYGPEGSGKALALDTPISTPKGWTTMGELSPGQEVFASDGSATRVTFATPVMTGHECFRVRFSDGTEIIADADHQWVTTTLWGRTGRWSPAVVTTADMATTLWARDGHTLNHAVQTCGPLEYPAQELLVAPYTLGAWLGDGTTDAASITCVDAEILDEIRRDGYTIHHNNPGQPDRAPRYRIARLPEKPVCMLASPRCSPDGAVIARGLCRNHYAIEQRNGRLGEWPVWRGTSLQAQLRELGVLGNKHIPESYLHASVAQRLALLQGLLDTDGTVKAGGSATGRGFGAAQCEFSVVNEQLARDVHELLLGLGIKVTFREAPAVLNGRVVGTRYRLGFQTELPVFRLPRKAERLTALRTRRAKLRYVTAVEPVTSVPVRCIQVDHPSHTYLAGRECVPTHNTTVALHALASAQKSGGIAAFIDAEHALDPEYAKRLGVDTDALLVSQPDTGEQALEIADMLIRSSAIDVIVIDSVAALVPRAEIEGEMGDSHVGLQARLMSQAMRKLAGALNQTKTTAIFINQLREKVGVMFGCMSYNTRVTLADGTQEKIGKIVNQRMKVEVLSYDPDTDRIVPRPVVGWFNNGRTERFLQFTVAKSGGNGKAQFAATENHLIRTPGGWRAAGDLAVGDNVMLAEPHRLSEQQFQVIFGSIMGDGCLSPNRRGRSGVRFRMGHGARQEAYLDWKASLLANIPCTRTTNGKGAVFADFTPLPELGGLRESVYASDSKKHLSWDYLKSLTPLALAIWYMDDGCFTLRSKGVQQRTMGGTGRIEICVEAMSPGTRDRLTQLLRDSFGLEVKLRESGTRRKSILQFTTASTEKFQELVAPYIHPSMDYKLLPRFRSRFGVQAQLASVRQELAAAPILDIHVKPKTRSMNRFDIEVQGSHNYFVDGVMVHNSPETTSGGRALKFYASVRLDIRRIETLKDGTDAVGSRTRVKVVKNKCLAEGTRVFDPVTGTTHRIEEIVDGRLPIHTVSADKRGLLEAREVVSWFDQGEQEVIGIKLRGTELWVTPDHKVLTEHGWRTASELAVGDRLARPRTYSGFGTTEPAKLDGRYRGSQRVYLADESTKPVLAYLENLGVSATVAAQLIGKGAGDPQGGMRAVLGAARLRRDRVQRLADALDDSFLRDVLAEQLWFSRITRILPPRRCRTFDVEVDGLHNLVAEDVVVHNCAPPFKTAEFDILFGFGISREGGLIDLGVEQSIVRKSGAWYTYEGDQLGQGKENARNFLRDNPDLANEIEKKIKEKLGIGARLDAEAADGTPADGTPADGSGLRAVPGVAPDKAAGVASARAATKPGGTPGAAE
jgi:recombination protein RecA